MDLWWDRNRYLSRSALIRSLARTRHRIFCIVSFDRLVSDLATEEYVPNDYVSPRSDESGLRKLYNLEKSRRDEVPSVFLSPAEKNGFPFVL